MIDFQMRFFSNDVHLERKLRPIVFIDDEIVIYISYENLYKAFLPIEVNDERISNEICINDEHPPKA